MNRVKTFRKTASAIALGPLRVPLDLEAAELSDCCPDCFEPTTPASVLDESRGSQISGRVATYRCSCLASWLCWWGPTTPQGPV